MFVPGLFGCNLLPNQDPDPRVQDAQPPAVRGIDADDGSLSVVDDNLQLIRRPLEYSYATIGITVNGWVQFPPAE